MVTVTGPASVSQGRVLHQEQYLESREGDWAIKHPQMSTLHESGRKGETRRIVSLVQVFQASQHAKAHFSYVAGFAYLQCPSARRVATGTTAHNAIAVVLCAECSTNIQDDCPQMTQMPSLKPHPQNLSSAKTPYAFDLSLLNNYSNTQEPPALQITPRHSNTIIQTARIKSALSQGARLLEYVHNLDSKTAASDVSKVSGRSFLLGASKSQTRALHELQVRSRGRSRAHPELKDQFHLENIISSRCGSCALFVTSPTMRGLR